MFKQGFSMQEDYDQQYYNYSHQTNNPANFVYVNQDVNNQPNDTNPIFDCNYHQNVPFYSNNQYQQQNLNEPIQSFTLDAINTSIVPPISQQTQFLPIKNENETDQLPISANVSSAQQQMDHLKTYDSNPQVNIEKSQNIQPLRRSVLPVHHFKKKSKSARQEIQQQSQYERPSSRGSVASEIDQYAQWYHMLSQYYREYYPHMKLPEYKPTPGLPIQTQSMEYANFCYQFYIQAQQQWTDVVTSARPAAAPDSDGRRTPHLYHTPHMRVSISVPGLLVQILPARPVDGDIARVELLDINQIANEAISEAALRVSCITQQRCDVMQRSRSLYSSSFITQETSGFSIKNNFTALDDTHSIGAASEDIGSSQVETTEIEEEDEITRVCADITQAWDRVDNVFFPGPLSHTHTLKADILAYLRDKQDEIQDRLPIDWESASLLLLLLEQLVKNNGYIQPSDLVTIILDGHEVRTSDLRDHNLTVDRSHFQEESHQQILPKISNNSQMNASTYMSYDNGIISQSPGQLISNRNSPINDFKVSKARSLASNSISDPNYMHNLILKAAQATTMIVPPRGDRDLEDRALDRYRQLLMNALPQKALEHACKTELWGHAFALAHRLGQPKLLAKVMDRFMRSALHATDPIISLYQLSGGEVPQIVNSVAYAAGVDTGEWRPHLAVLLSARNDQPDLVASSLERLGDSLLSRHLVFAAHVCYLLLDQVTTNQNRLPGKIWLIGHSIHDDDGAVRHSYHQKDNFQIKFDEQALDGPISVPTEAIQLTEIYEYCQTLRDPSFVLVELLPYKLAYAIRLLDSGLCESAYRYLECIGKALCAHVDNFGLERLLDQNGFCRIVDICLALSTRLQYNPDIVGNLIPPDVRKIPLLAQAQTQFPKLLYHCATEWIARLIEIQEDIMRKMNLPSWSDPLANAPISNEQNSPSLNTNTIGSTSDPDHRSSAESRNSRHVNKLCEPKYKNDSHFQPSQSAYVPQSRFPKQVKPIEEISQSLKRMDLQQNTPMKQTQLRISHSTPFNQEQEFILHGHQQQSVLKHNSANSVNNEVSSPIFQNHQNLAQQSLPNQTINSPKMPSLSTNVHSKNIPLQPTIPSYGGLFFNPGAFIPDPSGSPSAYTQDDFDFFANDHVRSRTTSTSSQISNTQHTHSSNPRSRLSSQNLSISEEPASSVQQMNNSPKRKVASVSSSQSSILNTPNGVTPNLSQSVDKKSQSLTNNSFDNLSNPHQNKDNRWFYGILGRFKRNPAHLPDDSKPKMLFDKEKNRWIDLDKPDQMPEAVPPPPVFPGTLPSSNQFQSGLKSSRYVNPLADECIPAVTALLTDLKLVMPHAPQQNTHPHNA